MSDQDYVPLGPEILASFPKDVDGGFVDSGHDPNVIIVFGWMGAQFSHLQKYVKVHREQYPAAVIFLVRCFHNIVLRTEFALTKKFLPLIAYLEQLGCVSFKGGQSSSLPNMKLPVWIKPLPQAPRILVHTFSNGGTLHLASLSKTLARLGAVPKPHASAMVIDSSPGGNYIATLRAFSGFLRNPFLRILAAAFISVFYFVLYIRGILFGTRSPIQQVSDLLIRADVLPWTGMHTPRLYIFSKADELVPWEQVNGTVRLSEKAGLKTSAELFEETPHVAHARADPDRYWSAVRKSWGLACLGNVK